MKTIALVPPRPRPPVRKKPTDITMCSSCEKPLTPTGECAGCSD